MGLRDAEAIAKQLDLYADYITAFALGLANRDFREGVHAAGLLVVSSFWGYGLLIFLFVVMACYRAQDQLLGKINARASKEHKWIAWIRAGHIIAITLVQFLQAAICFALFKTRWLS
jgi:hypothetical protein